MAGKTGGAVTTMSDGLNEAAEGIVHAMMAPDAGPHLDGLQKMLVVVRTMAHGGGPAGGAKPGGGAAPGMPGGAGTPGAPGAGPPGGGAANPAMPSLGGTPPGPPLPGGATQGIPQAGGDDLRRMLAMATGGQDQS